MPAWPACRLRCAVGYALAGFKPLCLPGHDLVADGGLARALAQGGVDVHARRDSTTVLEH